MAEEPRKGRWLLRGLFTVGIAVAMVGGGSLIANAATGTTTANTYAQEKSNWCWVATSKTVINHYTGTSPSQCSVFKWGKSTTSCTADSTGDMGIDVYRALSGGGVSDPGYFGSGGMSMTAIQGEVSVSRVVMVRWGWLPSNSTGHMVVLSGYNTSTSQVLVTNPAGSGSKTWQTLTWVTNDGSHQWTHSRYYIMG